MTISMCVGKILPFAKETLKIPKGAWLCSTFALLNISLCNPVLSIVPLYSLYAAMRQSCRLNVKLMTTCYVGYCLATAETVTTDSCIVDCATLSFVLPWILTFG